MNENPNLSDVMKRNPEEQNNPQNMMSEENLQKLQDTVGMTVENPKVYKNGVKADKDIGVSRIDSAANIPYVPKGEMRMLTPEEAAQFKGIGTPIDVQREIMDKESAKIEKAGKERMSSMEEMLRGAMESEQRRIDRHEEALADEKQRELIFQGDEPEKKEKKVYYEKGLGEEDTETESTKDHKDFMKEVKREIPHPADEIDFDEYVPAYDDDEEEEKVTTDSTEEKKEEENLEDKRPVPGVDSEEDYAEYLRDLQTVEAGDAEDGAITVVKDRNTVTPISSSRLNATKNMQDSSFLNAVTKFKKDNFRTVSVPLVNSGFCVDIVGTGAVDINMLYSAVDQNITASEYEMEKMKVVMRNVVGTHPKVPKDDLRNMIHSVDYQLMAYAHVAATLKDIETIQTCPECGNDFHIVCNASDLILNMDEMRERMNQIRASEDVKDYSLMLTDKTLETPNGFVVQLGHPSYADYIQYTNELKALYDSMGKVEIRMLADMVGILPFVRSVTMPNGVHTSTLYQRYIALGLLDEVDLSDVQKQVTKMEEQIIRPRFGIRRVVCPHCGKVNTNIEFDSLDALLFFHTTVVRLLNLIEK